MRMTVKAPPLHPLSPAVCARRLFCPSEPFLSRRSPFRGRNDVTLHLDLSPCYSPMKNTAPPLPAERPGGSGMEPVLSYTASGPQHKYTTASLVALDNICPHL